MKFIELHDEVDTFYVNVNAIGSIEATIIPTRPRISSEIDVNGYGRYCRENPKEILQKIAEATQSERAEIFQKFAEAEQCERSFMDEWKKEVEDSLSRLTVRKEDRPR